MSKLSKGEQGFSAVEVVLVLIIVVLIGAVGTLVYNNQHKNTVASVVKTTPSDKHDTTKPAVSSYLTIKEWGVKLKLPASISDASYQLVTTSKYLPPSAFLSTKTLDASADCTAYYANGATADNPTPTFQYVERLALTDKTSLAEGDPIITAEQAAQQQPNQYIKVGSYVYHYGHGNGAPCKEETELQESDFETAFYTIQAE